ncbi:MAG TPA: hypothetical protein VJM11_12725, partial [Nevskiaceae bacterium]|nr:hypothetical protein [Nevskiaceae bacterium]
DRLRLDPVIPAALDGLRVETTLLGRPFEIRYAIRGAGCGVQRIALNDRPVDFTCAANPHRRGAALVERAHLPPLLLERGNVLRLDVGD